MQDEISVSSASSALLLGGANQTSAPDDAQEEKVELRTAISGVVLGVAVSAGALSMTPATDAAAYPGMSQPQSYCSPSTGCYRDPATGQNKQAEGPKLTAREKELDQACRMGMAKAGLKWALSKKFGAIKDGAKAGIGPCRELERTFNERMRREGN